MSLLTSVLYQGPPQQRSEQHYKISCITLRYPFYGWCMLLRNFNGGVQIMKTLADPLSWSPCNYFFVCYGRPTICQCQLPPLLWCQLWHVLAFVNAPAFDKNWNMSQYNTQKNTIKCSCNWLLHFLYIFSCISQWEVTCTNEVVMCTSKNNSFSSNRCLKYPLMLVAEPWNCSMYKQSIY